MRCSEYSFVIFDQDSSERSDICLVLQVLLTWILRDYAIVGCGMQPIILPSTGREPGGLAA